MVRRLHASRARSGRGQEDDGLRARRAVRMEAARLDHLSDWRRHRHRRHVESLEEMEAIGWLEPGHRPKMVTVQTEGCAPIVRAFHEGTSKAAQWENPHTVADGLRVPKA